VGRVRIGQILRAQGLIDDAQLTRALQHQRAWGGRIGRALTELQFLSEEQLLASVGRQLAVPTVRIGAWRVAPRVLRRLPEKLIRRRRVLPLDMISVRRVDRLVVAFSAPDDLLVIDEVAFAAGMVIEPALAGEEDLDQAIAHQFQFGDRRYDALDLPPPPTEPMRIVDGRQLEG
jgi:type IV pilus assembly protein PilB